MDFSHLFVLSSLHLLIERMRKLFSTLLVKRSVHLNGREKNVPFNLSVKSRQVLAPFSWQAGQTVESGGELFSSVHCQLHLNS